MKRWGYVAACGMFLLLRPMAYPESRPWTSAEKSKQELLDLENHWLQVESDANALESILAPDFLHVVPAGIITKDQQLSFMRRHPAADETTKKHFEDMHVRVYGIVGIVNGIVVETGAGGSRRTLFTDVFAYRDGKWQAVSAQELPAAEEKVQSQIRNKPLNSEPATGSVCPHRSPQSPPPVESGARQQLTGGDQHETFSNLPRQQRIKGDR